MKLLALKNKKKGFTLLELLVVLAILAILIAIAVPVYKNQKEKAAITAHNANVRVLETAVESYRQDKGKYPGSVDELVKGDYIKKEPEIPKILNNGTGGKYQINSTNGNVSPAENAFSINKDANSNGTNQK
ncbi:MAG: prepilin-type N-terminal cleavage/methylation domain-containing protein [Finegoldia magna]|nr:prepilin-type N-terminal cleavage/methylation domain-containing protein [Finegoldia magna]